MNKLTGIITIGILCFVSVDARAYRLGDIDVSLTGGVSEVYDDNITYVKTGRIRDFITKPWVGLNAVYEGKTTSISVGGRYNHEFYAENSDFNNNSESFNAALNSELSKFDRISVSETWSRVYEPRSFEDIFGYTGGRYNSDRNRVNLGYARDISGHFGVSLRYSNEYNSYSRSDIAKSYYNTAGFEAAYVASSDLSFIAAYDYGLRNFEPGSNARTNTVGGGLRKYLTKQLYLDAMAGADFLNSYNNENYTKPFAAVSLSDDIDDRTKAVLSFSRRYSSVSYKEDLFNQWRVSASFTRQLLQRLKGAIAAFYGKGEYLRNSQEDDLLGASGALSYDINDNWRADLSYSYSHQTSTAPGGGYLKNLVTLGLTAEF